MDFVTSAANLRMHIFSMNMKSRFDVKCELSPGRAGSLYLNVHFFQVHFHGRGSLVDLLVSAMAGNIIPAIATTNAVIAGLIVLEGLKILSGQIESCRTVSSVSSVLGHSRRSMVHMFFLCAIDVACHRSPPPFSHKQNDRWEDK